MLKACASIAFPHLLLFSCEVVSKSLQLHGLQHTRLLCPPLSPGVCSNSYALNQRCYLTISSSATLSSFWLQSFSASGFFPNMLALHIRWPKDFSFSFSISTSSEYSGLISFRIDFRFHLLNQETLKSSAAPPFESINSLALSLLYGLTLTSVHDYWKNHNFHYPDFCQQSDASPF